MPFTKRIIIPAQKKSCQKKMQQSLEISQEDKASKTTIIPAERESLESCLTYKMGLLIRPDRTVTKNGKQTLPLFGNGLLFLVWINFAYPAIKSWCLVPVIQ